MCSASVQQTALHAEFACTDKSRKHRDGSIIDAKKTHGEGASKTRRKSALPSNAFTTPSWLYWTLSTCKKEPRELEPSVQGMCDAVQDGYSAFDSYDVSDQMPTINYPSYTRAVCVLHDECVGKQQIKPLDKPYDRMKLRSAVQTSMQVSFE